eukprot:2339779-Amphidinium_carterae.1
MSFVTLGFRNMLMHANNDEIVVKDRWLRFFGQLPHSVSPTIGRRLSVSFYTPRLTHKVDDSLWFALHELGFPVKEHFASKLPQVVSVASSSAALCVPEITNTPI